MNKEKTIQIRENKINLDKISKLAKQSGERVSTFCRHIIRNYLKRHKI